MRLKYKKYEKKQRFIYNVAYLLIFNVENCCFENFKRLSKWKTTEINKNYNADLSKTKGKRLANEADLAICPASPIK